MGNHLQPGCNETESTCLVCSFDAKATVKRMFAVLALAWIDVSESALSNQGLVKREIWMQKVRTYADQGLYVFPFFKASVTCLICYATVAGTTHLEVPII